MKKIMFIGLLWGCMAATHAEDFTVTTVKYAGPYIVQKPFMVDSTDVKSKKYTPDGLMETPLALNDVFACGQEINAVQDSIAIPASDGDGLHLIGFAIRNMRFGKVKISADGIKQRQIYIDGEKAGSDSIELEPGSHQVVIKCLTQKDSGNKLNIRVGSIADGFVQTQTDDDGKLFQIKDVLHGKRLSQATLSPNGKYLISAYSTTLPGGETRYGGQLSETATGKILTKRAEHMAWMPRTNKYYYLRKGLNGRELVCVEPQNGHETVLAENLPDGRITISPTEDYLILSMTQEGPKERKDVYEILEPDDRQPGWRNRTYPAKYDLKRHLLQPLTFGHRNVRLNDISDDGQYVLLSVSKRDLQARPTSRTSIYRLNVNTMQADLLVENDGFVRGGQFSPDGKHILVTGSPESFDGIGKNVRENQIPSKYDIQLYLLHIDSKQVTPLTRNFNPSVEQAVWSKKDNHIYFTAQNLDFVSLYRLNPENGEISQMAVPEDMVKSFSIADDAPTMVYYGQGASNSDRLYSMNLKNGQSTLLEDLSKDIMQGIKIGTCEAWNFVNTHGDTIYGRFYLPPYFDGGKKYPMIVNYYGGCSPTSRNFESRYPHHVYAALGYVVYVVNPSGATGFGQEFSARHVNTAGEGVAQDIIEGTQQFIREHPYVDAQRIGCIGASYGGFMTQYLQTKTDIFAAAISHAGISDHTSYWGEGYWGYSYSEVSMANSYPWSDKELYVERSPLFNADKIHTPLLFLHGSDDTNVPVGESIQMFTALKLLGRPTAFVVVDGQNHHILDYHKRLQWQNTIFAWFQKWLQGDDSWWKQMYPEKVL